MSFAADIASLVLVGALFGGMLFFAALYAPLVFIKLEPDVASGFIREVFPVYYLVMGVTSALAAATLSLGLWHAAIDAMAMALVSAAFFAVRGFLLPAANRARDARDTDPAAARRFALLHRASVLINAIQLVVVLAILVRYLWS